MKIGAKKWCKIQETLANLKCPGCFSVKVDLKEDDDENAHCDDCGCKFDFDPDIAYKME